MGSSNDLTDLSSSYGTYVILGAVCIIGGALLNNVGGWFLEDFLGAVSGMLRSPGRALFVGGFIAAGVAGDRLPTKVRVTALAVGAVLFLRFMVGTQIPFL